MPTGLKDFDIIRPTDVGRGEVGNINFGVIPEWEAQSKSRGFD